MNPFGRRRRLLVDKLQLKLLAINLVYTAAMVFVFVVVIFGPLVITTLDDSATEQQKVRAADRMLLLHGSTWPAVIIVALLFGFHSILYTHRIAGPLYGFRRVLSAVGNGDLTVRAGARSRDYLHTESVVINRMIAGLRDRARAIHDAAGELQSCSAELERLGRADSTELKLAVDTLESRIESLNASVDGFRLPGAEPSTPGDPTPEATGGEERRESVH